MNGHDGFEISKSYLGGGKFVRAAEMTAEQRKKSRLGGHYAMDSGRPRTLYHGTNEGAGRAAAKGGLKRPSNIEQRTVQAKGDKGVWAARDTSSTGAGPYAHNAFLRNAKGTVTRKEGPAMLRIQTEGKPIASKMRGRWLEFKPEQVKDAKLMRRKTKSDGVYDRITTAPEHLNGKRVGAPGAGSGAGGRRKGTYRGQ